jgi:hypothetical protein
MKIFIICLLALLTPIKTLAQGQTTTLTKGQPAPFLGTLLDAEAVANILAQKEFALKTCELDKQLSEAKLTAKSNLDLSNIKLERDILQKKFDIITSLKDAELTRAYSTIETVTKSNRWYWAYFVGGVLAGSALTVGVAYSISHASK